MIVYVIETFAIFSEDAPAGEGVVGIYRTLEGAEKAVAQLKLGGGVPLFRYCRLRGAGLGGDKTPEEKPKEL